jgi:protein-tyrosine phosphatase
MTGERHTTPYGPLASVIARPPSDRSYWVVDGRLLAGAYPWAPDARRGRRILTALVDAGLDTFVDLTEAGIAGRSDGHLARYADHLPDGRIHVRHPIEDMSVPSVAAMTATLDAVDGAMDEGRTVYVHCWGGLGRTGTVVGCWLMRHGAATADDVLDVLTELRRADRVAGTNPAPQTRAQCDFVRSWTAGL